MNTLQDLNFRSMDTVVEFEDQFPHGVTFDRDVVDNYNVDAFPAVQLPYVIDLLEIRDAATTNLTFTISAPSNISGLSVTWDNFPSTLDLQVVDNTYIISGFTSPLEWERVIRPTVEATGETEFPLNFKIEWSDGDFTVDPLIEWTVNADPLEMIMEIETLTEDANVKFHMSTMGSLWVDWGDGSTDLYNNLTGSGNLVSHVYDNLGLYTVKVACTESFGISRRDFQVGTDLVFSIREVVQWPEVGLHNLNLERTLLPETPFPNNAPMFLPVPQGVSSTFNQTIGLGFNPDFNQNINHWNTSTIRNLWSAFEGCTSYNQPLNFWDVSNVQSFSRMFANASSFNQNINNWVFNKDVNFISASSMFNGATSFNQPLDNWDTGLFSSMSSMFAFATSFNQDISNWDTGAVFAMSWMFQGAQSFNQDLSGWCVKKITQEPDFFADDTPAWTLPKPNWGFCTVYLPLNVAEDPTNQLWRDISDYTFVPNDGLYVEPQWPSGVPSQGPLILSFENMFRDATNFNEDIGNWDVSRVTSLQWMFRDATSFNQNINNWDISRVSSLQGTFLRAESFNQPLDNWDTSNVIDMFSTFNGATSFNQPLDNWDTSNVIGMSTMFAGAASFNQPLDNWDTSNVQFMQSMFLNATSFNGDISSWDVSNVTDIFGMNGMFANATSFNGDISSWDMSNVTNIGFMFANATSFNQDLSGWDVSNVQSMQSTFENATSFNQDLSNWCVSNITAEPSNFATNTPAWTLPKPVWGTCPQ